MLTAFKNASKISNWVFGHAYRIKSNSDEMVCRDVRFKASVGPWCDNATVGHSLNNRIWVYNPHVNELKWKLPVVLRLQTADFWLSKLLNNVVAILIPSWDTAEVPTIYIWCRQCLHHTLQHCSHLNTYKGLDCVLFPPLNILML